MTNVFGLNLFLDCVVLGPMCVIHSAVLNCRIKLSNADSLASAF